VKYRAAQAGELPGVSADTIRHWVDAGHITLTVGADGKRYFED
jgi:predicted site-specific integrase-resolvase